ncbi:MAG TPA: hypothetical protein VN763_14530, partial [Saprospiraceae bacterium]|nr:hypothetical protein [Saprospiraceae bacterium]
MRLVKTVVAAPAIRPRTTTAPEIFSARVFVLGVPPGIFFGGAGFMLLLLSSLINVLYGNFLLLVIFCTTLQLGLIM